jgi:hypothetical protein
MSKLNTLIYSSAVLLCSEASLASQLQHWQQEPYIQQSFQQIALQNEHGKSDGRLHKWHQPIRFTVLDRTDDEVLHKKMVTQQLNHLSHITGHDISSSGEYKNHNLTIIFSSEDLLEAELIQQMGIKDQDARNYINRNSVCVANLSYDSAGNIEQAVVVIPVNRARAHGKLMACVVEELTQIMGLPNDSAAVYPSIFNDHSFNDFLTGLDFILLKLLYHPSLKSGMNQTLLKQQLSVLLKQENVKNAISNAEMLVRENSLESWLD